MSELRPQAWEGGTQKRVLWGVSPLRGEEDGSDQFRTGRAVWGQKTRQEPLCSYRYLLNTPLFSYPYAFTYRYIYHIWYICSCILCLCIYGYEFCEWGESHAISLLPNCQTFSPVSLVESVIFFLFFPVHSIGQKTWRVFIRSQIVGGKLNKNLMLVFGGVNMDTREVNRPGTHLVSVCLHTKFGSVTGFIRASPAFTQCVTQIEIKIWVKASFGMEHLNGETQVYA